MQDVSGHLHDHAAGVLDHVQVQLGERVCPVHAQRVVAPAESSAGPVLGQAGLVVGLPGRVAVVVQAFHLQVAVEEEDLRVRLHDLVGHEVVVEPVRVVPVLVQHPAQLQQVRRVLLGHQHGVVDGVGPAPVQVPVWGGHGGVAEVVVRDPLGPEHVAVAVDAAVLEEDGDPHDAHGQLRGEHGAVVQGLRVLAVHVDEAGVLLQLVPPLAVRLLHPVQVHLGETNTHAKVSQLGHFTRARTPGDTNTHAKVSQVGHFTRARTPGGKTNTHAKVSQLGHFTRARTPGGNQHTWKGKSTLGETNTHEKVR